MTHHTKRGAGRPRTTDGPRRSTTSYQIPAPLRAALDAAAERAGLTMAAAVREAQAATLEYLRTNGLQVTHTTDAPECATRPMHTTDVTTVSGGGVWFAVTARTKWGRGAGRDESGLRMEDAIDEWEDKQIDCRGTSYTLTGEVPDELMAAAGGCHNGGSVLMTLTTLVRGKMASA